MHYVQQAKICFRIPRTTNCFGNKYNCLEVLSNLADFLLVIIETDVLKAITSQHFETF